MHKTFCLLHEELLKCFNSYFQIQLTLKNFAKFILNTVTKKQTQPAHKIYLQQFKDEILRNGRDYKSRTNKASSQTIRDSISEEQREDFRNYDVLT